LKLPRAFVIAAFKSSCVKPVVCDEVLVPSPVVDVGPGVTFAVETAVCFCVRKVSTLLSLPKSFNLPSTSLNLPGSAIPSEVAPLIKSFAFWVRAATLSSFYLLF
jgi:hypothetical protein